VQRGVPVVLGVRGPHRYAVVHAHDVAVTLHAGLGAVLAVLAIPPQRLAAGLLDHDEVAVGLLDQVVVAVRGAQDVVRVERLTGVELAAVHRGVRRSGNQHDRQGRGQSGYGRHCSARQSGDTALLHGASLLKVMYLRLFIAKHKQYSNKVSMAKMIE